MKRSINTKKKENTLHSYFNKIKDPIKEKEALSAIIQKTTRIEINRQPVKRNAEPIDLTVEDDDVIFISSTPTPENSQQNSLSDSQSSFSYIKSQRSSNEVITNTSKYNNRKWLQDTKDIRPLACSQEPILISDDIKPNSRRADRIVLKKPAVSSEPAYDWLSKDDVKPFSSNYNPYSYADPIRKPEILVADGAKKGLVDSSSYTKRKWNDSFAAIPRANSYGSNSSGRSSPAASQESPSKFWADNFNKKRKTESKPSNAREAKLGDFSHINKPQGRTRDQQYRPELSDEQNRVLKMALNEKKSLFFTGSAGTGKSVLLRAIIDKLGEKYGSALAVTASTGIAACNINGCTLHSFGGIGLAKESGVELARKIKESNRKAKDRWTNTKVLIIDEISMVDNELFDKLDEIARILRNDPSPFGGIQVIVTGDFFQLPPVNPNKVSKFAFEAKSWPTVVQRTVMLTEVFRQKDGAFVEILNEMRLGHISDETVKKFKALSREPLGDDGIKPTELYPLRHEVDESNRRRLDELRGEVTEFHSIDTGDPRKMQTCLAPQVMQLKEQAQVMLLKNMDADLVNGSIGVVVGFVGKGKYTKKETVSRLRTPNRQKEAFLDDGGEIDMKTPYPVVRFSGGRVLVLERENWSVELPGGKESASRSQIPLMLAWAISIHKSQGQTLDRVKVDLGKVFEKGQAYVALSRATSLDKLQILNFDRNRVMAHPTVTKFYRSLRTV